MKFINKIYIWNLKKIKSNKNDKNLLKIILNKPICLDFLVKFLN